MLIVTHPSYHLDFIQSFGYPPEVESHFRIILDQLGPSNTLAVLLHGSTARGELTYQFNKNQIEYFSDFEFIVVVKRKAPDERAALQHNFQKLELEIAQRNPLFHIDFGYLSLKELRSLPPILRNLETKRAGVIIYGKDIRDEIPDVDLNNLDYKELNEVLLWRLWSILLYLPHKIFDKDLLEKEETLFKYIVCRNILDLPTWFLPWEGHLVTGFKRRVEFVRENFKTLRISRFLDEQFPNFCGKCLEGKLRLQFTKPSVELYSRAISYFQQAIPYLFEVSGFTSELTDQLVRLNVSKKIFKELSLRWKLYEMNLLRRHKSFQRPITMIAWLWRPKQGMMLKFLLAMHESLVLYLDGRISEAVRLLEEAQSLLTRLEIVKKDKPVRGSFSEKWLGLRRDYADFMMSYYVSLGKKREYLEQVLGT